MTALQRIIKYGAMAFAMFLIVSIVGGIVSVLSGLSFLGGGNKVEVGEMKSYEISEAVNNLEIEVSSARLKIKTGEGFLVESNSKNLELDSSNGVLEVKETGNNYGFDSSKIQIVVTVPKEFIFDRVDISTGAGSVKIDTLCANILNFDLGAGEVKADSITAFTSSKINGGAGEMSIYSGELANLDFDMGIGEVNLSSKLTGTGDIDCGVGELNLTLIGSEDDYRIVSDKGIGEATLNGERMADDFVYGNGANSVEVDGGIGEVNVEFAQSSTVVNL